MRIGRSWRRVRWALSVVAVAGWAWLDPRARPGIVGFGVLVGLMMILARAVGRSRRAANEARHRYLHGSLEATPSAVTFTRGGECQSIGWDEVESVAYSEDPMTQEREWWLRGGGRPDRLRSIPDADADRSRLLGYFALYLPGFDPSVFERQVLGALRENPEAVVECWKRT